jgi:ketosteroid isomerase-like protein
MPLVLIVAACNQAAAPGDPSVITSRSEAWEAALNAKDIDGLAALYTDDTRLMPPNLEMSTGHDAVRAAFGGMIDAGLSADLTSAEASVSGDVGYNLGNYKLMAGEDVVDVGKYIEIWRRGSDGEWRIANDIWNSDKPAAPMQGQKKRQRKHKGMGMSHVMILHEVKDAEHWLAAWTGEDSRHDLFKANGAMGVHTFQSADNPNLTGLVIGVKNMDALNAMLSSEEGQAAAAEDGVIAESMQVLTEKK